jgi:signal transduction histidine kinase
MKETVDLNTAVETAVTLCRNLLKRSTRHFSVHSAKDPLPCVTGNRQQLEQVIVNLLQNACLALSDRDQCIEVTLSCDAVGQLVQLRVRDEGCGMTPDVLERVMDPFFTTRQTAGGTGMGLSISKSIVRKHGGRLAFESEPGCGTSVRLTLPVDPCRSLDQGGVYEP